MSIKPTSPKSRAWTLVEMMVALAVFSISAIALASLFLFSMRSFAAVANYAALDQQNRVAMDKITREIRDARCVTNYVANPPTLTLLTTNNLLVTYRFSPLTKTMWRTTSDGSSEVLLTNCNLLNFSICQRNPSNQFGLYPVASNSLYQTAKVIQLTWKTSRTINPTRRINSEDIQTARIVIRN